MRLRRVMTLLLLWLNYSTELPTQNCLTSCLQAEMSTKGSPNLQTDSVAELYTFVPDLAHFLKFQLMAAHFQLMTKSAGWGGLSDSCNFRHVPTRTTSILYVTIHKFHTFCGDESDILPIPCCEWTLH